MGELRSALDISFQKAKKITGESGEENTPLTKGQKEKIAEIRKLYGAKLAEREIMLQSNIEKVKMSSPDNASPQAEELKIKFNEEKKALLDEKDKEIEQIRSKKN